MENVNVNPGKFQSELSRWLCESVMSVEREYNAQPEVLMIGGVPIGTQGNFSASIGKAKSKKTFNVSAIAAAALSDETVLNYRVNLPEGKRRVLYVDTEQSQNQCLIVMKRIQMLARLPTDKDCERITFITLRKFTPEQRASVLWRKPSGHTRTLGWS